MSNNFNKNNMDIREKYKNECKQIQENCTYSAETHHLMASKNRRLSHYLQSVPAAVSAVTSSLVISNNFPIEMMWLALISSIIVAVSSIIDPNKAYQDHLGAAKKFTILKHDARFLHEALGDDMSDEAFGLAVKDIHYRYGEIVGIVPPTENKFFEKARKRIKDDKVHESDNKS